MNIRIKDNKTNNVGFTDLAVASFLALSFDLVNLSEIRKNRFEFMFLDSPELQKAVDDFYSNRVKVSPLAYFNSIKLLKGRLYFKR